MNLKQLSNPYSDELKKLEELGFRGPKRMIKLLIRTGGDFEVVKAFLEAKDRLKEASFKRKFSQLEISTPKPVESIISETEASIPENSSPMTEKDQQKLLRKKEKMQKKLFKKERRNSKKEEKKWKHGEKKLRHEKRSKNDKRCYSTAPVNPSAVSLVQAWPGVEHLYLDGNNMLFVTSPLRSLVLSQSVAKAEECLSFIARSFSQVMSIKCTVIFDSTSLEIREENFSVCSAKPAFGCSDDALVSWQEKSLPSSSGGCNLYVTSDVALGERLRTAGGVVYKPKEWFLLVAEILGGNVHSSEELDSWVAEFIKPVFH